ncbi:MAG: hypothetical protein OEM58_05270 [Nitrospirota bacterium]|nr:hypothetical protein [Nitrospirota bacterium]
MIDNAKVLRDSVTEKIMSPANRQTEGLSFSFNHDFFYNSHSGSPPEKITAGQ